MTSKIFVISASRAEKQVTLRYMKRMIKNVSLLVPQEQVETYRLANPGWAVIGCEAKGIAATRQYAVDLARAWKCKNCFLVDDDLRFYTRPADGGTSLKNSTPEQVEYAFAVLQNALDTYAHVTMGPRQFQQSKSGDAYELVRANNVHGYDLQVLKETGVRFDEMEVMEDYHVTLSLFERGFKNYGYYGTVWNQDGSGAKGGCSTYRTTEMQERSAKRLEELHPNTVKAVIKRSESGIGVMGTRWDVNVKWRKAYENRADASVRSTD